MRTSTLALTHALAMGATLALTACAGSSAPAAASGSPAAVTAQPDSDANSAAGRKGTTAIGLSVINPAQGGPVTVFHPTSGLPRPVRRGPMTMDLVLDGPIAAGNGRLVVISHGSGASPWVYADLASALVARGYIVAIPEHDGDNWRDLSRIGPASWTLRPREVSAAIDLLAADPRFAGRFDLAQVGMFGMSAGGHTALTLAGGQWSRARQLAHCEQHLAEDFQTCTGGATELTGGWLDGVKKAVAATVIRWRLSGPAAPEGYTDVRIRAIVAGVPYAVDFDPATLSRPPMPLGIVQAERDIWLLPKYHSAPVLAACGSCELVARLPTGGHGALLSPLPDDVPANIRRLLADPPGFDRATELPALHARIANFFDRHLQVPKAPVQASSAGRSDTHPSIE